MDELKNFYVFEYVYSPVDEAFTAIEGDVVGYVKATDGFDACERLGFNDPNRYFAKPIEKLEGHFDKLNEEAAKVKKLQEALQPMVDERKAEVENPMCPNCGGNLDKKTLKCPECRFGYELDDIEEEMKKVAKAAKKAPAKKAKKK